MTIMTLTIMTTLTHDNDAMLGTGSKRDTIMSQIICYFMANYTLTPPILLNSALKSQ